MKLREALDVMNEDVIVKNNQGFVIYSGEPYNVNVDDDADVESICGTDNGLVIRIDKGVQ
jgi:hypothetical protein